MCNMYMGLGVRGISILYASGDGGVRGGHDSPSQCSLTTSIPVFPSTCPYVTTVGATIGLQSEIAMNLAGGGFSNYFAYRAVQGDPPFQLWRLLQRDAPRMPRCACTVSTKGVPIADL